MEWDQTDETLAGRGSWNEMRMLERLRNGDVRLPLAQFSLIEDQPVILGESPVSSIIGLTNGILQVTYRNRQQSYVIECKSRSTPQTVQIALAQARRYAHDLKLLPLVFVPYLSDEALTLLETENVSGVDLSGNGIILAPGFTIWRSGQPNRYPETQTIRNLYRGASTLFVRCFLLRPTFESLTALRKYALSRLDQDGALSDSGTRLTKGTGSKITHQMEEDMLIRRDGRELRVLDAKRILEGLRTSYRPAEGVRLAGKTSLSPDEIWQRLFSWRIEAADATGSRRYAATGLGSAAKYRLLSGADRLSLYVSDLDSAADLLGIKATRVFSNVEIIEDRSDAAYFDTRRDAGAVWASPIQTWLELTTGGPREQDAAQTLEAALVQSKGEMVI